MFFVECVFNNVNITSHDSTLCLAYSRKLKWMVCETDSNSLEPILMDTTGGSIKSSLVW